MAVFMENGDRCSRLVHSILCDKPAEQRVGVHGMKAYVCDQHAADWTDAENFPTMWIKDSRSETIVV